IGDPQAADHEHAHDHSRESPAAGLSWDNAPAAASLATGRNGTHSHGPESTATAHSHEHVPGTADSETGGGTGDHGLHEHDGFVHSHEPDLAHRLATLTSKLS